MFIGEFQHRLDAKSRLIIPSKFRDELGDTFVVTRGLDGCLTVYTYQQWEQIIEQLKQLPSTKKEVRQYTRFMLSKAQECTFDSQGRIQLTASLLEIAEIEKDCVVIGVGDHIEIWAQEKWMVYGEQAEESFEDVAESITEFLR